MLEHHPQCGGKAFLITSTPMWDKYKCLRCGQVFKVAAERRAQYDQRPARTRVRFFPARRTLSEAYADLAAYLPGYRPRQSQLELAQVVIRAIEHREATLTEVATRAGRSLGYLMPLLEGARLGLVTGPIIIATRTAALRRQLIEQDLPVLERLFRDQYGYAVPPIILAKGPETAEIHVRNGGQCPAVIVTSHNRLLQQSQRRLGDRPGLWPREGAVVIDEAAALLDIAIPGSDAGTSRLSFSGIPLIVVTGTNATAHARASIRAWLHDSLPAPVGRIRGTAVASG
jgi:hypothetical protein